MVKSKVLALASCPANMKMKRFPRTAEGENAGLAVVPLKLLAPTTRSLPLISPASDFHLK